MTRREAVIAAVNHKSTGCLPYQLELTALAEKRMIAYSGDPDYLKNSGSFMARVTNETFTDLPGKRVRDMFGVVWDQSLQEGDFGIVSYAPLAGGDAAEYHFPDPDEENIRTKCGELLKHRDRFTMYGIGFSLFERAWTLRGMQNLLCDMIEEPEATEELFERITEYNLRVVDIVAKYPIDSVCFGDDWGQQRGLIMGLPHWKHYILPNIKKMYERVKSKGMYVAQHSCGDCAQVFPFLADAGLDMYNTFQPEVYDIKKCKKEYGKDMTFWGAISTQCLLPFAEPDELEKRMEEIISVLDRDGGYILAPTHAMPNDIPEKNIERFLKVARRHAAGV